jgi:hypothetical protein
MVSVFLGGTCNNSTWRNELIDKLDISYFNPVVDDWTEAHRQIEIEQRKSCDYVLYVLTPLMYGVYSIAELIDDSNKQPNKTLFCILKTDSLDGVRTVFDPSVIKSIDAVGDLAEANGAKRFFTLQGIADYLNDRK